MRHSSAIHAIALAICGALLLPVAGIAGGHKTIRPMVPIEGSPEVAAAVTAIIHETAEKWNSQDFSTVLELWDPNEAFPTYLAEEQAQWFVGWDMLRAYLDPPRPNPIVEAIREEMRDVQVKQIGPDLAIAIWEMHFEMKTIGSNPIGEEVRVSAVFRNTPDGWRYIHWAESPKTAMVYIEDLYEKDVAPGWDAYFEGAQQRKKEAWDKKKQNRQ
jgi:hypothetical protein